jgi:hypothetical protein
VIISFLVYPTALKMEVVFSSQTSLDFNTSNDSTPEDSNLYVSELSTLMDLFCMFTAGHFLVTPRNLTMICLVAFTHNLKANVHLGS